MAVAIAVFVSSLIGIAALFAQKAWELRRGSTVLPTMKLRADRYASEAKVALERGRVELEHLPPTLVRLSHVVLHQGALAAAAAARYAEREMHRLADMVSHKRGFENRESHNEFLKRMGEHKSGDGRMEEDAEANGGNETTHV
jgi:hypothetical protein